MEKINLLKSSLIALSLGLFVTSCGSDGTDILQNDPNETPSAFIDLTLAADNISGNYTDTAEGVAGGVVKGRVKFTADRDMKRLYVTRTLPGGEPEPFVFTLDKSSTRKLTKPDGSIDLDQAEQRAFDFSFDLDVPTSMSGDIIYNFWATSGRGDFRDPSKRLRVGVGTIDVKVGTGSSSQSIISKSNIELKAPLADGSSSTFVSFFDLDKVYKINEGSESSTFWDFGYFYGSGMSMTQASLYSTNDYPFVDIITIANENIPAGEPMVVEADLKRVYFKENTSINFDTVTLSEIQGLTVSATDPQRITGLSANKVVEFIDTTGRKGLIKVESITGTDGSDGAIVISVKQLPAQPIMDGSNF